MKRYESYKDSGIEWIGGIPSHWVVSKMKTGVSLITEKGIPSSDDVKISPENVESDTGRCLSLFSDYEGEGLVFQSGDILLNKLRLYLKKIVLTTSDGFSMGEMIVLRKKPKTDNRYLYYSLFHQGLIDLLDSQSNGVKLPRVSPETIMNTDLMFPPLPEQEQIVSFLDEKTSKIDDLIKKKEQKIELLREYRTSLINRVITKGLNPDVPMKDSGVEWIGEIPSHWEVKRLKHISEVIPSNVDKHVYPEEIQVRLCNYTDVYYNETIDSSTQLKNGSCDEHEYQKYHVQKNDVIITKDSESPDDIGVPCLITEQLENVVCGYHLTILRPVNIDGEYLFRFVQTDGTRRYFEVSSNGMTRYGLGKSSIENLFVCSPPIPEQEQIVSYLDQKTGEIDSTIDSEKKKIDLLKEYRQSLISSVITGKIKVVD
jgi:type I restriction enzyme S subunit